MKKNAKRIVVKIGSSLFFTRNKGFDQQLFDDFVAQMLTLTGLGDEVVIVSSGAIALGMDRLGLKSRPKELAMLQAAAAIGQNILMDKYRAGFRNRLNDAQVLLTWEDFNDRKRYLNAKNTILTLLKLGTVPVINENDTVATDEIRFGDNDRLSALVATMISADLLIMLTDVDGLLDAEKKLCRRVARITREIRGWACPTDKQTSVGGMITKIDAARIAVESGMTCVIANGRARGVIARIAKDPFSGGEWTVFDPQSARKERERWIAFGTKHKGSVCVDDGARKALLDKKSLLAVGIVSVNGRFNCGDVIAISSMCGEEFAAGVAGFGSAEIDRIKGTRCDREVIHSDNIVII